MYIVSLKSLFFYLHNFLFNLNYTVQAASSMTSIMIVTPGINHKQHRNLQFQEYLNLQNPHPS